MNLIDRVKRIVLRPKEEWPVIAGEKTSVIELYTQYIMPLAAIGPAASIIGLSLVGVTMPFMGTYRLPLPSAVLQAVVQYALTLVGVYVLGLVIDALAPTFSGEKNFEQSFKLAAYSYTPGWLAGIFILIPIMGVLSIVGLYGLYLLFLGIPILKKSPQDKSLGYTIAVIVAAVVVFMVIGFVSRAFIPTPQFSMPGM